MPLLPPTLYFSRQDTPSAGPTNNPASPSLLTRERHFEGELVPLSLDQLGRAWRRGQAAHGIVIIAADRRTVKMRSCQRLLAAVSSPGGCLGM